MKKILSLLFTLLIFVGNAWGADCYLVNSTETYNVSAYTGTDYITFNPQIQGETLSFEINKVFAATGYVDIKQLDKNNKELTSQRYNASDLSTSYQKKSITLNVSTAKISLSGWGTLNKHVKNIKVTQKKYLTVTAPSSKSLAFDNVEAGTTSSAKTITVSYSSTSVNVSSSNSAFKVTPTSVGNSSCGKTGTQDVTVTFNPTSVGNQNGKITIGSNTISVSGTGTLAVPTNLKVTSTDYTSISLAWDAVSGANKYYVYVGSDKVGESTTNSITFPGLEWDSTYKNVTVKAVAVVSGNDVISNPSNVISSVSTKAIIPPANVTVSNIGYDHATITWSSATAATSYVVYVDDNLYTETAESTCQLTDLPLGSTYKIKVESKLNGKETDSATEKSFSTYDLQAPLTVVADQEHTSYSSVPLLWDAVTDATGYCIVNKTSGEVVTVSGQTTNSYLMNGLEMNTRYSFNVYPLYNGQRSKHYTTSNVVVTKKMDIDLTDCMIYENTTEQEFFMSAGESYYPDNDGYVMPKDERVQYTQKLTFQIKKSLGYVGRIYDVRLYIKVGNKWQDSYIWNGNDLWTDGSSAFSPDYQSQDYKTVTVTLPKNVTAIRFRGSSFSGLPTEWAKYGGNERYIKDVRVYTKAEAEVSPQDINYNLYIGQKESKTFNLKYSNRADVKFNIDNPLFNVEFPSLTSCTVGNKDISVSFKPETLDSPVQGSISIMNGDFATVALNATVKALPAPENFKVSETTSQSVTLTWDDVNITETGYKVICKQGDNVIETKNLGGDATTCTFEGLQPNKEYTYIITTMYNSIENESAEITGKTNMLPAPQNFALDVTSVRAFSARFTWNKVAEATGYKLEWSWDDEITSQTATVGDVSEYKITELEPDTKYSVKITTLYGDEEHGASDNIDVTTTCVINTIATGDEPHNQLHTVTLLSGEQLDDLSFVKGSTIKFKSYTNSTNIKFVQLNVTINGSKVSYSVPEIEIEVSSNVYIESVYEYAGIAQVVDEHGDIVYGTLTDAVNAAEEGATINLLGDVEQDMVVNKHIYFNGNGHDIDNLYIKKNGNVELTGDVTVVMDFGLEVNPDKAGQYDAHDKSLTILGDAYIDVQFDNVKRDKWYAFSVPFPVKMDAVKNAKTLGTLVYGSDYMFLGFDGEARAAGEKGWITYAASGTLEPGKLYMIGTDGSIVHRFYKVKSAELISNVVSFNLESHTSAKGGNLSDWNALGNSQLFNVGADQNGSQFDDDVIAQIYKSTTDSYLPVILKEHVMSVTSPIFVQKTDKCFKININKTESLRSANAESALYNLQITKEGAANFDDQMFVAASDDAPSSYVAGYALMKLGLTNSIAQIYSKMYNTNLCMINAPYSANGVADIPLTIDAPAAGNYTLSLGKQVNDGTALYLVKDGAEIHNFNADGSYSLYLAKGSNNSYSLRVKATDVEDITTPATETEANGVNVYVKENVLVIESLAEGSSYSVGNTLRTLNYGVSNGDEIRIPLTEKGVYWVNTGSAKVKVLNK